METIKFNTLQYYSFWYLLSEKFTIPEVVFTARISVGSVYVSGKLSTHPTPPHPTPPVIHVLL